MNSCILMATIISEPELRSTQDNMKVANVLIEFEGTREDEPPAKIKLVGWGKLAEEIEENYHPGDRIIIEGRLSMNLVKMKSGNYGDYTEKRAELVASRIYSLGTTGSFNSPSPNDLAAKNETELATSNSNKLASGAPKTPAVSTPDYEATAPYTTAESEPSTFDDGELDEIPF
ncbi:MAG: single-stranded DNA-binding protein [Pleurocapsa sp.]